jgi:UDP-4-amino-4,6-dideoxy-N-acetyl-beta-L-altrosamine transaminase
MIPYGRQQIDQADIDAVVAVLQSDWLTQGPVIPAFEQALAARFQANYAVAVCNATAGLHLACLAAGLGPNDWLWTTPNTFLASANCGRYCGAQIDFVDIAPDTWNMDANKLASKLAVAAAASRLPKVVIPVAFSGQSCDMAAIRRLADHYGFLVIEDASHAVGADYMGRPVGCGAYADMTVFSFHPVKIITTGEGGAVLTQRDDLYPRLVRLRSHGMVRELDALQAKDEGAWYYEQTALGFNYRITDIQAALGLSQLGKLDGFIARRRELAARYDRLLRDLPLQLPTRQPGADSAWHLYVVRLQLERLNKSRRQVFDAMRAASIGVNVHYIPVHTQPYYQRLGFKWGDFPEAESYYAEALTLPLFAAMTEVEQDEVVSMLRKALA